MFLSEISVLRNYPLVCFAYYCNPIRSPGLLINPDLLPQGGAWSDTAGGQRRERRRGTGGCSGTRESSGWGRVAGGRGGPSSHRKSDDFRHGGRSLPTASGSSGKKIPPAPRAETWERRSSPHRGRKFGLRWLGTALTVGNTRDRPARPPSTNATRIAGPRTQNIT